MRRSLSLAGLSIGNQGSFLSMLSEKELKVLADKHQTDVGVSKFPSIPLLKLYLVVFLKGSRLSLRGICSLSKQLWLQMVSGLGPMSLSGLSKRNQTLSYLFFQEAFDFLRTQVKARLLRKSKVFGKAQLLKVFDTTFVRLSLKLFPWLPEHQRQRGLLKFGLKIDDGFQLPEQLIVQMPLNNDNKLFEEFIDWSAPRRYLLV